MGGWQGILGAVLGALAGAMLADLLGQPDLRVPAAIAGSFIGGALAPGGRPRPPSRP
ncbi:MAG TPA: hypothetical protein VKZ60_03865 [Chloroflexota bacterium]|nr:hypothetical protein [Chloroflexota bacterium]